MPTRLSITQIIAHRGDIERFPGKLQSRHGVLRIVICVQLLRRFTSDILNGSAAAVRDPTSVRICDPACERMYAAAESVTNVILNGGAAGVRDLTSVGAAMLRTGPTHTAGIPRGKTL
jgi:hypothetical protein